MSSSRKVLFIALFFVVLGALTWLAFTPGRLELHDLKFAQGKITVPMTTMEWLLDPRSPRLTFRAPKVLLPGAQADNVVLTFKKGFGMISAERIGTQRAALTALGSSFRKKGALYDFDRIRADFLGQEIRGRAKVLLGKTPKYDAAFIAGALPAQTVIETFEWDKKVSVTGIFSGKLDIEGEGEKLARLEGVFDAAGGGDIRILDQAFLQRIADNAKQPIEIVRASFENYHYNTGRARFRLEQKDLLLNLDLEGDAGKRNLEVNLHDLVP
jgi:hypothetical protein